MVETSKSQKFIIATIILVIVFLIGSYILSGFFGTQIINATPIFLYLIVGFLLVIGFFVIKNSQQGTTIDLDKMIPLFLVAAGLIYILLKFFPSVLPNAFSILATRTLGGP